MKQLCLILIILAFLFACKKGEEDPTISLRSRKARLCKTWKLDSGSDTLFRWGGPNYFNTYRQGLMIVNHLSAMQVYIKRYNFTVSFEKDNRYTFDYKFEDTTTGSTFQRTEIGTWSFIGKDADNKNKEQILLLPNSIFSVSEGVVIDNDSALLNNFGTKWEIVGLWNDKLHIKTKIEYKSVYYYNTMEYSFKPL